MAHLTCVKHNKRVVVIEDNSIGVPYAHTFHRNVGPNDYVTCDSHYLTIDGDNAYIPDDALGFGKPDSVEDTLNKKHDALIYS